MSLEKAVAELKKGKIISIFDSEGREGEADAVVPAAYCDEKAVRSMRTHAGGLLCLAMGEEVASIIGLPFMSDLLLNDERLADMIYNKTKYGDKPAFSISINHRDSKTGISDDDRAKTIQTFAEILAMPKNQWREKFIESFRTPGHVNLLIARDIRKRRGHTELSVELARKAGLPSAMVLCEITGSRKQMTRAMAESVAKKNRWLFLTGKDIIGE